MRRSSGTLAKVGDIQTGMASWYGADFNGRRTANGEIYDMHTLTAAHRTAPFGTQVRVTNLDNNQQVVVRVNDRGPFVDDRVIDLSMAGAKKIAMIGPGVARVKLEFMDNQGAPIQLNDKGFFFIQIGAFQQAENAQRILEELRQTFPKLTFFMHQSQLFRVRCGPYQNRQEAEQISNSLDSSVFFSSRNLKSLVIPKPPY
jgi:rare lipoprotein A